MWIFSYWFIITVMLLSQLWLECNSMAIIGIFTQVNDKVAVVYRLEWSIITTRKMPLNLGRPPIFIFGGASSNSTICKLNIFTCFAFMPSTMYFEFMHWLTYFPFLFKNEKAVPHCHDIEIFRRMKWHLLHSS